MDNMAKDLRDYIVENFLFGDSSTEFSNEDSFMEKGILDSTGILDMITFIEETYKVKIDDKSYTITHSRKAIIHKHYS